MLRTETCKASDYDAKGCMITKHLTVEAKFSSHGMLWISLYKLYKNMTNACKSFYCNNNDNPKIFVQ